MFRDPFQREVLGDMGKHTLTVQERITRLERKAKYVDWILLILAATAVMNGINNLFSLLNK